MTDTATAQSQDTTQLLINSSFIEKAIPYVKTAKTRIWICAYTWRWYGHSPELAIQQFNQEIVRAKNRGVDVRAVMYYSKQAELLKRLGFNVRLLTSKRMMHSKALLFDDQTLIIGSHNLTKKGTEDNFEVSLITQDAEPCLQFERFFTGVWQNLTK